MRKNVPRRPLGRYSPKRCRRAASRDADNPKSTVENVRADLIDYLPEAIISADSREYDELAELMTRIIRENHLRCAYDDEYAKLTHDLLVGGYSVQQVGFDPDANGGIGGAYIKAC